MKTSVFVGASVDGFIARKDGGLDFLDAGGNEPHGYDEFIASIDAIVMGRNTFDTVLGFDQWPFGTKPVIVLTSRPKEVKAPAGAVCEAMNAEPLDIVRRLGDRGLKHLYIDGGVTIQRFLSAGLIQRLIVTRVPVLIGSGVPLFGALSGDIRLTHVATRSYPGGLVQSEYLVG